MIKFININQALNLLGYNTLEDYISGNSTKFNQTNGTHKDAIIFFLQLKKIWAKGTFYDCANNDSIYAILAGYSTTNVSGNVLATDTILQALEKLEVKVNSKTSNTGTVTNSSTLTADAIVLGNGNAGIKTSGKTITTTLGSDDTTIPTSKAIKDAIDALPEPMVFKGSLGTEGTITTLPNASSSNEGFTYKVITDGTYASTTAKIGDTFISAKTGDNTYSWVLIPSGDEPSGTVTSVGLSVPTGLTVSGGPITSSGTLTVAFDTGYSIPTTDQQSAWSSKQNAITDGSATIASVSNNIVTIKAGVSQSSGAIGNSSGDDITLAKVAKTGSYNDLSNKPTIPAAANNGAFQLKVDNTVIGGTSANTSSDTSVTFAAGGAASVDGSNNTITYTVTQAVYDTTKANPTYGTFTTGGVITNSTLMAVLDWEELD